MATKLLYKNHNHNSTNIIKYPIVSNKALELVNDNRYSFIVDRSSTKTSIKLAIEELFDVKVIKVNTCNIPRKKKRIGKYIGWKSQYKKALVTLAENSVINIFI